MSAVSMRLLDRLDFDDIRARRVTNYRQLAERMRGVVTPVFADLPAGVCPLFFPIIVPNKACRCAGAAARGVDALEFWNDRVDLEGCEHGESERFFRTARAGAARFTRTCRRVTSTHVARQVSSLNLRMRLMSPA